MATKTPQGGDDEFVPADEVVVSPRGRKANLDAELVSKFAALPAGMAWVGRGYFGAVPKADRARVSQIVRKHWRAARADDVRIDYTPEGVIQVRAKAAK